MAEIKDFLVTVPAPVSIGVREMAAAGAVSHAVFQTVTDLMSVRGCMGMDTGAVTGKSDAVFGDETIPKGGNEGGETEKMLEPFFIMERKFLVSEGVSGHGDSNPVMFIREFFTFAGLTQRLRVFILWEKVIPAVFLGSNRLSPEPVDEIKVRAKWREGIRGRADEQGKQAVSLKFPEPDGKAGKAEHQHKDKGTDDLGLVFSRPAGVGIESGKILHDGIQVKQPELLAYRTKFKAEPCALRRIKMNFSLMQEV